MERIDSRLPALQVRRRNPFGVAVRVFAGGPAPGFDDAVLGAAAEGQFVDVGAAAYGVVGDVMNLAVIAGHGASRGRTATILGVQHNSLSGRGESLGVIQRQGL